MKLFGFTLIKTKELEEKDHHILKLVLNNTKLADENYRLNTLLKIAHPGLRRKKTFEQKIMKEVIERRERDLEKLTWGK